MNGGNSRIDTETLSTEALVEELEHFRAEKQKIREVIGSIGGTQSASRERTFTVVLTVAVVILFILDVMRHVLHVEMPLPPLFSIEIGILAVSLKIIFMINNQTKVEHFQFWILNSIEFRLTSMAKQLRAIEKAQCQSTEGG